MKLPKIKYANGDIVIPGDKSISHRSIMLSSLATGDSYISGFLLSDDCISTINCFKALGIDIENNHGVIKVSGKGLHGLKEPKSSLYAGNSGTTARLLSGILSAANFSSIINGDESLNNRPMDRIIKPLELMGASIESDSGLCPLSFKPAKLNAINYALPIASAQLKSAILLAGLYADGVTTIKEKTISRNHTEIMLASLGVNIVCENNIITISPPNKLIPNNYNIPGDISSAMFFIVATLLLPNSEIILKNVGINPTRTGAIDILKSMGGNIKFENINYSFEWTADIIVKSSSLTCLNISGDIIPRLIDEIPILCIAGVFASGTMIISDCSELKIKESNRIKAMCCELEKAGVSIHEMSDGMIIYDKHTFTGAHFDNNNDHRIAMALSIFALISECEYTMDNTDITNISFPNFYKQLIKLGETT